MDSMLQVTKINDHTTFLALSLERILPDFHFHRPSMTVNVGTLAIIAGQKMCTVKSSRGFEYVHGKLLSSGHKNALLYTEGLL